MVVETVEGSGKRSFMRKSTEHPKGYKNPFLIFIELSFRDMPSLHLSMDIS
jgi:hypothetical protein